MEFTDKEGCFFFYDNEKDPVQKSSLLRTGHQALAAAVEI